MVGTVAEAVWPAATMPAKLVCCPLDRVRWDKVWVGEEVLTAAVEDELAAAAAAATAAAALEGTVYGE